MVYIDKTPYKLVDWIDINKLSWNDLNENPRSIHLLEQNKDKLCLRHLMHNKNAIFIIEENLDKMNSWCWDLLSSNINATDLLEQNLDNVNWWEISENPNAINIIKNNFSKIDKNQIWGNPLIFEINYSLLANRIKKYKEELMQKIFHPYRLEYFYYKYKYDIYTDEYI